MTDILEAPPPLVVIPEDWSDAAKTIASDSSPSTPPITVICGPKNSGKSTFSRYLLNTLLQRYKEVAYLDTDVGQSEFTPPGCLSLITIDRAIPDFSITSLKTPERCYFFGDVSSKRDPEAFMNCVIALYGYYRNELCSSRKTGIFANVPLIVNTPGWVKGLGLHILEDMLKHIAPTHVVKINLSSEDVYLNKKDISPGDKNLPDGYFWLDVDDDASSNLIEIFSARNICQNKLLLAQNEARSIREQKLMYYFMQCFPSDMGATTMKEFSRSLASHTPYQVSLRSIKIRHLHCEVPSTEILYSLNATIVGLAVSRGDSQSLPVCVGLGIVRSIDISKNLLYVITPVPPNILASVDLLIQGFIQIPTTWLQVQGCISPYMSANVLSANDLIEDSSKKAKKNRRKNTTPEIEQ